MKSEYARQANFMLHKNRKEHERMNELDEKKKNKNLWSEHENELQEKRQQTNQPKREERERKNNDRKKKISWVYRSVHMVKYVCVTRYERYITLYSLTIDVSRLSAYALSLSRSLSCSFGVCVRAQ